MSEEFPLPDDLPEPEDDGAADHLSGHSVPSIALSVTDGTSVDLSVHSGPTVVYCYPKTGRPERDVTPDNWEEIPGARGCTPESRGFRDRYEQLLAAGADEIFGLSVQSTSYQCEARDRLDLPFELLSDAEMKLTDALELPTFEAGGETLLKRLTVVVLDGHIGHVFYPVFPPDAHATEVLEWLKRSSD